MRVKNLLCSGGCIAFLLQEHSIHKSMLLEDGIRAVREKAKPVREKSLGINHKVIHIKEFEGLSEDNMVDLVDYFRRIKSYIKSEVISLIYNFGDTLFYAHSEIT